MGLRARFQIGAPQVTIDSNLPVTLWVLLYPFWGRDVLRKATMVSLKPEQIERAHVRWCL